LNAVSSDNDCNAVFADILFTLVVRWIPESPVWRR